MYTENMRRVVHNLKPPKGFGVSIIDNEHFITIKLDEMQFITMSHDEKIDALQYTVKLKSALEQEGAIVLVTREALK